MKPLIRNQRIAIDSHLAGGRLIDMSSVHIHKRTKQNITVDGQKYHVEIEIPLHGGQNPSIVAGNKELDKLPRQLKDELNDVLSHKKRVVEFAKEVVGLLQNYPDWKPEYIKEALRRVANIVGIHWSEEQLDTFSNEALGYTCFMQLFDTDDNTWYCLKVNNHGLCIEDTMSKTPIDYNRPKYIIANVGHANMGKSSTINKVWNNLSEKNPHEKGPYYHDWEMIREAGTVGDVKGTIKIGNCLVGIESQGDPYSRMPDSMDDFVNLGCDVILTACRTRGETYNKLFDLYRWYRYEIILAPNPHPYFPQYQLSDGMLKYFNENHSITLANMIEQLAKQY